MSRLDGLKNLCPENLIRYAFAFIGVNYRWGGANPMGGLDCSGFCLELLKAAGIVSGSFDTTAQGLFYLLTDNKRGEELAYPGTGAFAFYGSSKDKISHVAFCLDTLFMIEAGGGDSSVKTKTDAEAANAFVRMRPIKARKDLVAFATPYY